MAGVIKVFLICMQPDISLKRAEAVKMQNNQDD